jgi:hypothetical protein
VQVYVSVPTRPNNEVVGISTTTWTELDTVQISSHREVTLSRLTSRT